ncbi:cationic amino acid transporter 4-like [Ptychodera flava]|uniref:cationic amino acid transporter 4-like n=1 Tax=Ptychodera flava TaxID=63121 RepID=UPI003969C1A8
MAFCLDFLSKISRLKTFETDLMETSLKRCLTTLDLTLLGIGGMVGAGLYVLTGTVAKDMAGPAVIISFLIAGFASLLAALCYAEFGARVPKTGSAYIYTYVTMGEMWAFLIGWNIILEYLVGGASVARAWSGYFDELLDNRIRNFTYEHITGGPWNQPPFAKYPDLFALVLITIVTIFVALGAKFSAKFNTVFASLNLCVVLFVVCVGLYFADINNWKSEGGFAPYGFSGIMSGAATCFFAYIGFDAIATSGEEAKNPARSIPIAVIVALCVASFAYVGVSTALTLMVPYHSIKPDAALPDAFHQHNLPWAEYIVGVGALCGITTSLMSNMFSLPRCIYAMASDGLLFSFLAKVNARTQVPVIATVVFGIFTGVLAVIFDLEALVEFLSIGTLLAYTIVAASVIVLRYQAKALTVAGPTEGGDRDDFADVSEDGPEKQKSKHSAPGQNANSGDYGKLKKRFENLRFLAQFTPGTVAAFATLMMGIFMFALAAVLAYGSYAVTSAEPWAIVLVILFSFMVITSFTLIILHNQNTASLTFKVPLVPFVPALSMFCNAVLMMKLQYMTWIRFAVWVTVGMILYFTYGIRHSKEARRWDADNRPEVHYFVMPQEVMYTMRGSVELQQPPNRDSHHGDDTSSETSDTRTLLPSGAKE